MWDLPRPGLEPLSPALAGRFSTTAPPGKPNQYDFCVLERDALKDGFAGGGAGGRTGRLPQDKIIAVVGANERPIW